MAVPFFCFLFVSSTFANNCTTSFYDARVELAAVHDGDTLRLKDGRKLRIIGINTPELERKNKPADPLAHEARNALQQLLQGKSEIKLRYGKEKYDRYNRLLAHPFLSDGTNITEQLLKKGMGFSLVVPPNNWQSDCYKKAEDHARQNKLGIWKHPHYQPVDAQLVTKKFKGYYRVKGKVQRVGESRYSYWLNLSKGFAVRIKKQDAKYFGPLVIKNLENKTVIARGWIYNRNNEMRMQVRHSSALEVVN